MSSQSSRQQRAINSKRDSRFAHLMGGQHPMRCENEPDAMVGIVIGLGPHVSFDAATGSAQFASPALLVFLRVSGPAETSCRGA